MAYYKIKESELFDCEFKNDELDHLEPMARSAAIDKRNREGDKLPRAVCFITDSPRKVRALQKKVDAKHKATNNKKK